jgi:hypothetical protein
VGDIARDISLTFLYLDIGGTSRFVRSFFRLFYCGAGKIERFPKRSGKLE